MGGCDLGLEWPEVGSWQVSGQAMPSPSGHGLPMTCTWPAHEKDRRGREAGRSCVWAARPQPGCQSALRQHLGDGAGHLFHVLGVQAGHAHGPERTR